MKFILMFFIYCLLWSFAFSQWTKITALAPHASGGGMILQSDGSVLVKTSSGTDQYGNLYDKLTPNINGSYVNGTCLDW